MILRAISATFAASDTAAVIEQLRAQLPIARTWPGLVGWTHGLRRAGDDMHGLTLTVWVDFDAVRQAGGGRVDRDLTSVSSTGLLRNVVVDHFELVDPGEPGPLLLQGTLLGVVRGMVKPGSEPRVHELLRGVRAELDAAGVEALHVGRRVISGMTELLVVAIWRDRARMHAFAQGRTGPTIATDFTDELLAWRFQTYDALSLGGPAPSPTAPAALVIDKAGICIDVTDGVERILGFPGELVLRQPIGELVAAASQRDIEVLLAALAAGRPCVLPAVTIRGGDGRGPADSVIVRIAGEPGVPSDGLHTLQVDRPAD